MDSKVNQQGQYQRIARFIDQNNLPCKQQKLGGLKLAAYNEIPMKRVETDDITLILVDGVAIDTSELETGYWL